MSYPNSSSHPNTAMDTHRIAHFHTDSPCMDIAAMPSSTSCTFIYSKILDNGNFNLQNFVPFLVNTYILGVNGWTGIVVVESNTNLMTNTDID